MKFRAYLLACILFGIGVAVTARGGGTSTIRTKEWLLENTPRSVGSLEMRPGTESPDESYIMDIPDLKASGIVCRIMTDGVREIDTVVVNSDRGESFHDPAGCFRAQDWEIVRQRITTVKTKTLGEIPVNALVIRKRGSNQEMPSAYLFRHNDTIFATQSELLRAIFFGEVLTAKPQEGNMYRFIGLHPGAEEEELLAFVGEYMDETASLRSSPQ
jgi:hypothetical protein